MPDARAHFFPAKEHFMFVHYIQEILAGLLAVDT
jgi:hypothetical protein